MKKIGLLCPIFSLPNQYGIGDFSECAYTFIDYLSKIKYSIWQILPLNPTDRYGCPYTSTSSFAFEDAYVSLTDLKARGLIKDIVPYSERVKRINFKKVKQYKQHYLNEAYENFKHHADALEILKLFSEKHPRVIEYATYIVLRNLNHSPNWNKWKKKELIDNEHLDDVNREIFKQYILSMQWDAIHKYAKEHDIEIIGDIPFYVGFDSADVFYNRKCFLLDENNHPTLGAGVPPDYYSEDGQFWGNPIYNWDYLSSHNFPFIYERIVHASKIYDITRLDHFRAFDTYYVIPSQSKNAKNGEWKLAPGYEFFSFLFSKQPNIKLIAEDLGDMREEVFHLRDAFNLPGMQVVEFSFIEEEFDHHPYPYVYKRSNSVVYISTHDSCTAMYWLDTLGKDTKQRVVEFLDERFGHHHVMTNLFKYAASLPAETVVLSITDVHRLGKRGRINVPGLKSKNNWSFRFNNYFTLEKNISKLTKIALDSGRAK